jgi:hypothetical protein
MPLLWVLGGYATTHGLLAVFVGHFHLGLALIAAGTLLLDAALLKE